MTQDELQDKLDALNPAMRWFITELMLEGCLYTESVSLFKELAITALNEENV